MLGGRLSILIDCCTGWLLLLLEFCVTNGKVDEALVVVLLLLLILKFQNYFRIQLFVNFNRGSITF